MNYRIGTLAMTFLIGCLAETATATSFEEGLRLKNDQQLESAAAVFTEIVRRQANDLKALEQLAIVQGWLQRYDDSIATWRQALTLTPDQVDFRIGLARVLYWKGEREAALVELNRALARDPDHIEALTLKGDVLMAQNAPASARRAYEQARVLAGTAANPELDRKIAGAVPPRAWRLDVGGSYDHYDNARGDENSLYTQLGYRLSPKLTLYGRYDRYDNFGTTDQGLAAGGYWLIQQRLLLNAEVGGTLDEVDFRPDTLAALYADLLLDGPLQPLLGLRHLRYDNGDVTTITPGLRLLRSTAQLELRYSHTDNIDGGSTGVFSARASYDAGRYAPYLAYTVGEEALPPQALADIRIYGAGCVFNLSPTWGLRADYSYEDREDIYRHHALGLGLTYRY